ncbi:hypothetical protein DLJ54_00750 [Corynebacterium heidelbergense]|uniref:Uncharacterized protein n=1 Tax=Corynebacterium heidelbergense TaxID=2055947 RepID=A0A364V8N9_9CORY|nr:hypothetical protein DLJ54_00750 [Corynebacterium heidelbergense]
MVIVFDGPPDGAEEAPGAVTVAESFVAAVSCALCVMLPESTTIRGDRRLAPGDLPSAAEQGLA